jgi:hypothetical protein
MPTGLLFLIRDLAFSPAGQLMLRPQAASPWVEIVAGQSDSSNRSRNATAFVILGSVLGFSTTCRSGCTAKAAATNQRNPRQRGPLRGGAIASIMRRVRLRGMSLPMKRVTTIAPFCDFLGLRPCQASGKLSYSGHSRYRAWCGAGAVYGVSTRATSEARRNNH